MRKMSHLVECMVGKEEKEATRVPHSHRDQQLSGSGYYPTPTTTLKTKDHHI